MKAKISSTKNDWLWRPTFNELKITFIVVFDTQKIFILEMLAFVLNNFNSWNVGLHTQSLLILDVLAFILNHF